MRDGQARERQRDRKKEKTAGENLRWKIIPKYMQLD